MTTALEAYLTGIIHAGLANPRLPIRNLRASPVLSDRGEINGIIKIYDDEDRVRATISIQEVTK